MRALILVVALFSACGPRPEEYVVCKRVCAPLAWEVPQRGVCHCIPRMYFRAEVDAGVQK
jgi:hypothetical protein